MRFHVIWRKSHEPEEAASGHTKAGGDFYAQTQAQPGGLSL